METNAVRRKLVETIGLIVRKKKRSERINRILLDMRRNDERYVIQRAVRKYHARRCKLGKWEQNRLHMFFSPLRIPAWLTPRQVGMCIRLQDELSPPWTLIKDEPLIILDRAIRKWRESFPAYSDRRFTAYLSEVLKAKLWAKMEVEKTEKFFDALQALPEDRQKSFMKFFQAVLKKLFG